jgi:hypothetical protein
MTSYENLSDGFYPHHSDIYKNLQKDTVEAVVVVGLTGQPDAVPQTGTWNHKITISQDSATSKTGANFMPAAGA